MRDLIIESSISALTEIKLPRFFKSERGDRDFALARGASANENITLFCELINENCILRIA